MPLLLDARRAPSWFVQKTTSFDVIVLHQILLVFEALSKDTTVKLL